VPQRRYGVLQERKKDGRFGRVFEGRKSQVIGAQVFSYSGGGLGGNYQKSKGYTKLSIVEILKIKQVDSIDIKGCSAVISPGVLHANTGKWVSSGAVYYGTLWGVKQIE
jgi:hypothetical protein